MHLKIGAWVRSLVTKTLAGIEFPGTYYSIGKYAYLNGATVSPSRNRHLLHIAPGVALHDAFFNVWAEIIIEDDVILGHQVMFLTGTHEITDGIIDHNPSCRGGIIVKKGAWVASRAMLLGGITIGVGSMIGAGSVVTKSVPDYQFWAGNPAKFIRQNRPTSTRIEDE